MLCGVIYGMCVRSICLNTRERIREVEYLKNVQWTGCSLLEVWLAATGCSLDRSVVHIELGLLLVFGYYE